jgi:hypothetical protein
VPARGESTLKTHLEIQMAKTPTTAQGSAAPVSLTGKPFGEMTGSQKMTWIGKVVVMLITGGFVFPNIFVE